VTPAPGAPFSKTPPSGTPEPETLGSGATVSEAARRARRRLVEAGVATPDLDARILVGHATGLDRAAMIAEGRRKLDDRTLAAIDDLVARRAGGEPVGRILGRREFWGLDFALGPDTLEPRPDSETIVEAALDVIDSRTGWDAPLRIADLGTGTGCLLIALLSELPQARGLGVDISDGAVRVARSNAETNGVAARARFVVGSWTDALDSADRSGGFDVIVANPPYIESGICGRLDREVADYDPIAALDGGADGLDAYRAILTDIARVLKPGGALIFELGQGQRAEVAALAEGAGLSVTSIRQDLAGTERALVVNKAG